MGPAFETTGHARKWLLAAFLKYPWRKRNPRRTDRCPALNLMAPIGALRFRQPFDTAGFTIDIRPSCGFPSRGSSSEEENLACRNPTSPAIFKYVPGRRLRPHGDLFVVRQARPSQHHSSTSAEASRNDFNDDVLVISARALRRRLNIYNISPLPPSAGPLGYWYAKGE